MSFLAKAAIIGAFASSVLAHGTVSDVVIDGKDIGTFKLDYYYAYANGGDPPQTPGWYAEDLDNGFVTPDNYSTPDIICHKNAINANETTSVAAGSTVDFVWTKWPHGIGPVLTYVANCGTSCSTVDKTTLKWVKIDEAGYADGKWAAQTLIDNNSTWTTTVPETLAAGKYVFRHEIIALHGAGSANGAQNYPQCVNIEITGSGTDSPAGVAATTFYKADDAGILFNPYGTITDYKIPGPALYGAGSGSGSSQGNSTGSGSAGASASAPVSSAPAATSAAAAPATSAAQTSSVAAAATSAAAEAPSSTAAQAEASEPASSCSQKKARRHARDVAA